MVSLPDIKAAYDRIRRFIHHTPVMTSRTINSLVGCEVLFKCENFQRTGAFKFRGAFNTLLLLSKKEKARGVIAHSSGNHAQAVALAAKILGISATIVMPRNSSSVKLTATKGYEANVVLSDSTLDARVEDTSRLIAKHDFTLIHPYDDPRIIAGAGTAALEFIEEI